MPRKKDIIPEYQSEVFNGKEYFRTRIKDADGKRIALYASTCAIPTKMDTEKLQKTE